MELSYIIQAGIGVLLSVIAFFMRSLYTSFRQSQKSIEQTIKSIAVNEAKSKGDIALLTEKVRFIETLIKDKERRLASVELKLLKRK